MRQTLVLYALLAALSGASLWGWRQRAVESARHADEIRLLQLANTRAQEALKRSEATLAFARQKNAATARERALAGASLAAATASQPAWAAQPVPKEVQDALQGH